MPRWLFSWVAHPMVDVRRTARMDITIKVGSRFISLIRDRPPHPHKKRHDELLKLAVEHCIRIAGLDSCPEIFHHLVGMEHIRAYLAPPTDLLLVGGKLGCSGFALLQFFFVQLGAEHLHRGSLVHMLAALALAGNDDSGRDMGYPDCRIGRIYMLPARPARSEGIDTKIGLDNFYFDIVGDLGKGENGSKRGVAAGIAVEGRYSYKTVNSSLGLEIAVGVFTGDGEGAALHAGLIAGLIFGNLGSPPLAFAVAEIHPQEHLGPVLGLGPAGAGIYGKVAGAAIVRSGEHPLEFGGNHLFFKLFIQFVSFLKSRLVLDLAAELDKHADIFSLTLQAVPARQYLFDHGSFAKDDLRPLIIIPETGCGDAGLYLLDILPFAIYVKETPEAWKSALRALLLLLPLP